MDSCELVSIVTAISCGIAKCVPQEDLGLIAAILSQVSSTLATITLQQDKNKPKDSTAGTDNTTKSIPCDDTDNTTKPIPCDDTGTTPCKNPSTNPCTPPYNNQYTFPYTNPYITPYSPYSSPYTPYSSPNATPNSNQNTSPGNNMEAIPITPNPEIITE